MLRTMLKSKIHRATLTDCNLDYEGSIAIDSDLLAAADILAALQAEPAAPLPARVDRRRIAVARIHDLREFVDHAVQRDAVLRGRSARTGDTGKRHRETKTGVNRPHPAIDAARFFMICDYICFVYFFRI